MEKTIEKNKYIIYNEDNKVLVFVRERSGKRTIISFPKQVLSEESVDFDDEFYKNMTKLLIDPEDLVFLKRIVSEVPAYKSENNKLKKHSRRVARNYYSCYKEFTKEDYINVMGLCRMNKVWPVFLTIEELKKLTEKTYEEKEYVVDEYAFEGLGELEKRLSFIKY